MGKLAVPELVQALDDEDRDVRRYAARALGDIGPEAREAVPKLTNLLHDEDRLVRNASRKALARIQ